MSTLTYRRRAKTTAFHAGLVVKKEQPIADNRVIDAVLLAPAEEGFSD